MKRRSVGYAGITFLHGFRPTPKKGAKREEEASGRRAKARWIDEWNTGLGNKARTWFGEIKLLSALA